MLMSLLRELAKVQGSKFATFTYTKVPRISEKTGKVVGELLTPETSKHLLLLGASKTALYRKDIEVLTPMLTTLTGLALDAANELHASRVVSLEEWANGAHNPAYTLDATLVPLDGVDGVSVNINDGSLRGTSELDATTSWPFLAKKPRKALRISWVVLIGSAHSPQKVNSWREGGLYPGDAA